MDGTGQDSVRDPSMDGMGGDVVVRLGWDVTRQIGQDGKRWDGKRWDGTGRTGWDKTGWVGWDGMRRRGQNGTGQKRIDGVGWVIQDGT